MFLSPEQTEQKSSVFPVTADGGAADERNHFQQDYVQNITAVRQNRLEKQLSGFILLS